MKYDVARAKYVEMRRSYSRHMVAEAKAVGIVDREYHREMKETAAEWMHTIERIMRRSKNEK